MKTLDYFLSLSEESEERREKNANGSFTANVILRPFQQEAYEAWKERGFRGTIIAPTGTGKTIIAGYAIKTLGEPTLVVCPTERILKMWRERLREKFGLTATAYYGGEKRLGRITISIYNTIAIHHPEIVDRFKFIVLDEVHHVASEVFQRVLRLIKPEHKVMALTATLRREDERHNQIKAVIPVVYCLDLAEAMRRRLVAPVKVIPIPVSMNRDELREYSEIERRIGRMKMAAAAAREEDDRKRLEQEVRKLTNMRRRILSRLEAKKEAVYKIALKHPGERILVFSESIESIEGLKRYLLERGVKAETYHSQKPEHVRDMIFSGWGKSFQVLLACRALDEGIDVPECGIAVIIASGLSVRQLVQRKGRIMRPREGKIARLYVIYAQGSIEAKIPQKIEAILNGIVKLY